MVTMDQTTGDWDTTKSHAKVEDGSSINSSTAYVLGFSASDWISEQIPVKD